MSVYIDDRFFVAISLARPVDCSVKQRSKATLYSVLVALQSIAVQPARHLCHQTNVKLATPNERVWWADVFDVTNSHVSTCDQLPHVLMLS